ncbi:MAG: HAD family phosphatase [Clostridia bacterium]|nr:HAD family phosphatase [Clostridia bacterium]
MSSLPFQAIVFDLDDTLLRDDLTISDRTIMTLRRLSNLGVRIIPASGRAKLSMKSFVDQIGCASLYISCNGAEIWDAMSHELLHAEQFSTQLGQEIAAFGKAHQVYAQTYDGPFFFYNEESVWAERYAASSMLTGKYVGDLEVYIQEPRSKILMMASEEKISSMLQEARQRFQDRVSVTCSKPYFLEFNPLRATKGIALSWAAEQLGISLSRFLAFGDSLNDLSMLQAAGRGVLMSNGRPELRSLCDDVCGSNQEDGVAAYLEKLYWEEKI